MLRPDQRIAVRALNEEFRSIVDRLQNLYFGLNEDDKPISISDELAELRVLFYRMRQVFIFPDKFSEKVGDFLTIQASLHLSKNLLRKFIFDSINLLGLLRDIANPVRFSES